MESLCSRVRDDARLGSCGMVWQETMSKAPFHSGDTVVHREGPGHLMKIIAFNSKGMVKCFYSEKDTRYTTWFPYTELLVVICPHDDPKEA